MQILTMAGFALALLAPAETEGQNAPPRDDTETLCIPNRSPQRGTRRDGTRKPTVQCNLVRDERRERRSPQRENGEGMPATAMVSYDRTAGSPQQ